MSNVNNLAPVAKALTGAAGDLAVFAQPGLQPALIEAMNILAAGGGGTQAIASGVMHFAQTPAGRALGTQATRLVTPMLDQVVKFPLLSTHWGKLTELAAKPGAISGLVTKNLGTAAGPAGVKLAEFTEKLLGTATTKGFGEAIKFGTSKAPGLLKLLGPLGKLAKFAKFLPGVGLAVSLLTGLKALADPSKNMAQKLAAIMDIGAGVVGLIPGVGTGAQLAIAGGSMAVGMAADSTNKGNKGWGSNV